MTDFPTARTGRLRSLARLASLACATAALYAALWFAIDPTGHRGMWAVAAALFGAGALTYPVGLYAAHRAAQRERGN